MKRILAALAAAFVDSYEYYAWEWESEEERAAFRKYFRWFN